MTLSDQPDSLGRYLLDDIFLMLPVPCPVRMPILAQNQDFSDLPLTYPLRAALSSAQTLAEVVALPRALRHLRLPLLVTVLRTDVGECTSDDYGDHVTARHHPGGQCSDPGGPGTLPCFLCFVNRSNSHPGNASPS
jgi:hypothetical protein